VEIIEITPENISKYGFFCVWDQKHPGHKPKYDWLMARFKEGLKLKLVMKDEKPFGMIEYMPWETCWRAIDAPGYMVIHCIHIYGKENQNKGVGSKLVQEVIEETKRLGKDGVAAVTTDSPWMAGKGLFLKKGFKDVDTEGDFVLMALKLNDGSDPKFKGNYEEKAKNYKDWTVLYSAQCPYNASSIETLRETARDFGVELTAIELKNYKEAQNAPTPYGVFALIHDGKVLEYHYVSKRRCRSIIDDVKNLQ